MPYINLFLNLNARICDNYQDDSFLDVLLRPQNNQI